MTLIFEFNESQPHSLSELLRHPAHFSISLKPTLLSFTLALRILILRPTHHQLHTKVCFPGISLGPPEQRSPHSGAQRSRYYSHLRPHPPLLSVMGGPGDSDRRGGKGGKRAGGGRGRSKKAAAESPEEWRDMLVSKKLSYVLRHGARDVGLEMDERGFVNCADLVCDCGLFRLEIPFTPGDSHARTCSTRTLCAVFYVCFLVLLELLWYPTIISHPSFIVIEIRHLLLALRYLCTPKKNACPDPSRSSSPGNRSAPSKSPSPWSGTSSRPAPSSASSWSPSRPPPTPPRPPPTRTRPPPRPHPPPSSSPTRTTRPPSRQPSPRIPRSTFSARRRATPCPSPPSPSSHLSFPATPQRLSSRFTGRRPRRGSSS